ncbi:MAG: hypothetical protein KZQ64_12315 [gamma proteobacterium symbiont of Bathyaustriella thionipta]|nr:hypothetical protein [gamma proteobacterium symbiont of Bathyaustriella thionipta]MCU7949521.1 hypothetical protein [gamma proteobacterium symbiont of Bathyaustriella thionipta]MCU7954156.1 hypothetical protein [gamma proteobacterium symbiont of Bathyaustriella thionipta]MCU7956107.1 hypothetical protein [gamma proteobacterium symbiont of Bathyaustriella thionipta]MCU7967569.1 hypothetical protein [gamma proteobacterium symbiont of Bathyaustriella thionipta]
MNKIKATIILSLFLLLITISPVYAATGLERIGFIESINDSNDNTDNLALLQVSGKTYKFDWDTIEIIYKKVYIDVAFLDKGMKISFRTNHEKITAIKILSEHDALINH